MTSPARLRARRATDLDPTPAPRPEPGPRAGFVLYVSLPEEDGGPHPRATATQIAETADLLRELAEEALPGAQTSAALSLVDGTRGDVRSIGDRITHLRLLDPVDDTPAGDPDVLSGSGDAG